MLMCSGRPMSVCAQQTQPYSRLHRTGAPQQMGQECGLLQTKREILQMVVSCISFPPSSEITEDMRGMPEFAPLGQNRLQNQPLMVYPPTRLKRM